MNAEQLKQLKKGDEIFIRAKYKKIDADGDVLFLHSNTNVYDEVIETESYTHPGNVILPPSAPKYDPCRLFKKGDKVRLREYNGRKPYDFWHKQTIKHFGAKLDTVYADEKEDSGNVDIFQDAPIDELMVRVHSSHLELVTPVEELEPYYVGTWENMFAVYKKTQTEDIIISMFSQSHPHAKEAAEAERDRLNAEHRKGQK